MRDFQKKYNLDGTKVASYFTCFLITDNSNIERHTKMSLKYCGNWLYFNQMTGDAFRFFCGSALCERKECKNIFWQKRVKLVSTLIVEYKLTRFFTLTMDREMPLEDAQSALPCIWNKFLTICRRKYPEWLYVAIRENHKDGYPHLHGFTNQWMSVRKYSEHWQNCGGGKIAWVEKIKSSGEMGEYVAKQLGRYMGKQNIVGGKEGAGKGVRTIWRSEKMKASYEKEETTDFALVKEKIFDNEGNMLYNIKQAGEIYVLRLKGGEKYEQVCNTCSSIS